MANTFPQPLCEELKDHGWGSHDLHLLANALACSEVDLSFEERLYMLAKQGLMELADWIIGRKRFSTVAESDISRVLKICLDIRGETPSLELLVNHFNIPESRGRNMLSRMNYGEARRIKALSYSNTAVWLKNELNKIKPDDHKRKTLTIGSEGVACIHDAVWEIISDFNLLGKESKYKEVAWPEESHKGEHGAVVTVECYMWEHIREWLEEKAREIERDL